MEEANSRTAVCCSIHARYKRSGGAYAASVICYLMSRFSQRMVWHRLLLLVCCHSASHCCKYICHCSRTHLWMTVAMLTNLETKPLLDSCCLLLCVCVLAAAAAAAAPGGESAGEETDVCESCDNSERLWEMPPHLAAAEGTRCLAQASSLQHPTDRPVLSCALFCSAIIRCYEGVFGVCIDSELVELACCVPTALWHGTSVCAALQNYTVIVWAAILYARGSEAALLEIADGGMTHCSVGLPSQLGFRAAVWPCANS